MNLTATLTLLGVLSEVSLIALVLYRAPKHPAHLSFSVGMLALAVEVVLGYFGRENPTGFWHRATLFTSAAAQTPWLFFSLCYGRGNYSENLSRFRLPLLLAGGLPLAVLAGFSDSLLAEIPGTDLTPSHHHRLGRAGVTLGIYGLFTGIIILANIERTFKNSIGVMRWRIKYMILGVASLMAFRVYLNSQAILYTAIDSAMFSAEGAVALVSSALIFVSLRRERVFDVDIYPSHALLFQSVTILIAGAYLILVGFLAQLARFLGGDIVQPFQASLVVLALATLAIAFLSERTRRHLHLFVSRHLRRPTYDYRQVWATFSSKISGKADEGAYCHAAAAWLAETFRILSANIWLVEEGQEAFKFGGSTSLTATAASRLTGDGGDWKVLVAAISAQPELFNLDETRADWGDQLRKFCPGFFPEGGHRICVPLLNGGELLGLLLVGDRVGGVPFSTEDLDLLKCVGEHLANGLQNLRLAKRLLRAKEFEAFQTMSAFFVHDLKNTASTLSLTLQNLREHFGNPAFRDDALRAVGKSVQHLEHLIGRLTQLRQETPMDLRKADLSLIVDQVLKQAGSAPEIHLEVQLQPGCLTCLDAEQFSKVVLNLILNARDAILASGEISIATKTIPGHAVLTVSDTGCGMTDEFVRNSLFRPFQTTKKRGIGIGMFQSKLIVDAHRGRFQVESVVGKGTCFRVLLPALPENS